MKLFIRAFGLLSFLLLATLSTTDAKADMFGYRGQENADVSAFQKWQSVNRKYAQEESNGSAAALNRVIPAGLQQASLLSKLQGVNNTVNRSIRYVSDDIAWGVNDYWASPAETLAKGYGDCDDFAIVKYFSLLRMGVPATNMQIVILTDTQANVLHAVLAVRDNGRNYILDNRRNDVYEDVSIAFYRPIYSLTANSWVRYS